MPLYEYECPTHGRFDTWKSMELRATAICPDCGTLCSKVFAKELALREANPITLHQRHSDGSLQEIRSKRDH